MEKVSFHSNEKVSFHSNLKKGNAKECSNYCTVALISHTSKVMLKILPARLQQYVNHEPCSVGPPKVMVESSDKTWSIGEGNGKPLQYFCLENPMNSMKRQKDRTMKGELPRSVGAQYAMGDQWRNNSRKNEEMEPKQKQHPVVDVIGDGSKINAVKSNIG